MTDPAADPIPTDPRARARRQRWVMLATFGVLLLVLFGVFRFWAVRRVEAELQAIRARGEPMQVDDFIRSLPELSRSQREAVTFYRRAFDAFMRTGMTEEEMKGPLPVLTANVTISDSDPLPAGALQAGEAFLTKWGAALTDVRKGIELGPLHLPEEWTDLDSLNINEQDLMIFASELLQLEAIVAADRGDADRAVSAVLDAWRLSQRIAEKPYTILDHLTRGGVRGSAVRMLERVANRVGLDEDQLARLANTIHEPDGDELHHAMLYYRAALFTHFPKFLGPAHGPYAAYVAKPFGNTLVRPIATGYWFSGLYDLDRATFLEYMDQVLDALKLPMPSRLDAIRRLRPLVEGVRFVYTRLSDELLGRGYQNFVAIDARNLADVHAARAAIAVERFRLAEGRLPEKLNELVPRFIDAVPDDPFTGKPLVYRKLDKGYLIYSLGEDATDNGGADKNAAGQAYEPGSDIPFRVVR